MINVVSAAQRSGVAVIEPAVRGAPQGEAAHASVASPQIYRLVPELGRLFFNTLRRTLVRQSLESLREAVYPVPASGQVPADVRCERLSGNDVSPFVAFLARDLGYRPPVMQAVFDSE